MRREKSQEKRCEEEVVLLACLEIYLHGIQVLFYIDMISSSSTKTRAVSHTRQLLQDLINFVQDIHMRRFLRRRFTATSVAVSLGAVPNVCTV